MKGQMAHNQFYELKFTKPGHEVVAKAKALAAEVEAKIKEREQRILQVAERNSIQMADVLAHMDDFAAYSSANGIRLTVGDMEAIKAEARVRSSEKESLEKLLILARNLDPNERHTLSFEDLDYLGF